MARGAPRGMEALRQELGDRHISRSAPGRRRRHGCLPGLQRSPPQLARAGSLRQGRPRGHRRSGGCQQRRDRRRAHTAAGAGNPRRLGDRRHPRRPGHSRHHPRSPALHRERGPRRPALRRILRQLPADPGVRADAASTLRAHHARAAKHPFPGDRAAGRRRGVHLGADDLRHLRRRGHRHPRLRPEALRLPGDPRAPRPHPRPDARVQLPPRPDPVGRRSPDLHLIAHQRRAPARRRWLPSLRRAGDSAEATRRLGDQRLRALVEAQNVLSSRSRRSVMVFSSRSDPAPSPDGTPSPPGTRRSPRAAAPPRTAAPPA